MKRDINNDYFEWIISKIEDQRHFGRIPYYKLLKKLYETPYRWIKEMDSNRAANGVEKRWIFARENKIIPGTEPEFFNKPCSVLEVLFDLAGHIEGYLLCSEVEEDRTPKWFWMMVLNLGLDSMDDRRYDDEEVSCVLENWMDNRYDPNGRGGLFYIPNLRPGTDIRDYELWYQMNLFFTYCNE